MAKKKESWISKYMRYTENTEPPLLYKEWVAVSVIASALQRKCWFEWGHLTFYPNMYVVLVGPAGKCRKGTAMSSGKKLLRMAGIDITAEAITREALIRQVKENTVTATTEEGKPIIHCSTTVFSPELAVFLGENNKTLMSDLTDWFDCADKWTYRTKGQGTDEIVGVWINLIGATTPELIQTQLPKDAVGGGLASRIVFVYEDNKHKTVPYPSMNEEQKMLEQELKDELEDFYLMSGKFKCDEDFIEKYINWYTEADKNPKIKDDRFTAYNERRATHIMKLSVIMSASSRNDMVMTGEVFDLALDLLERTEVKMPRTFGGYGSSKSSDLTYRIMEYIALNKKVGLEDIIKKYYYDLESKDQLDQILNVLQGMNFCKLKSDGTKYYVEYLSPKDMEGQFD